MLPIHQYIVHTTSYRFNNSFLIQSQIKSLALIRIKSNGKYSLQILIVSLPQGERGFKEDKKSKCPCNNSIISPGFLFHLSMIQSAFMDETFISTLSSMHKVKEESFNHFIKCQLMLMCNGVKCFTHSTLLHSAEKT